MLNQPGGLGGGQDDYDEEDPGADPVGLPAGAGAGGAGGQLDLSNMGLSAEV